jgi:uncharacterized membrane protein
MSEETIDSFLFALVGVLFVGLSIPLIQKRVPPNRYYGFRTARTLSNPEIWYTVNRISGTDLLIGGALITISSLTMLVLAQAWRPQHVSITLLLVMVFSLTGVAWHGFKVLRRM